MLRSDVRRCTQAPRLESPRMNQYMKWRSNRSHTIQVKLSYDRIRGLNAFVTLPFALGMANFESNLLDSGGGVSTYTAKALAQSFD